MTVAAKAPNRHAAEAARTACMATHAAAGLAVGQSKTAGRLLRAAEGLLRSAVAVLTDTPAPIPAAATPGASSTAATSKRRPRPRARRKKATEAGDQTHMQTDDVQAGRPSNNGGVQGGTDGGVGIESSSAAAAAAAACGGDDEMCSAAPLARTSPKLWSECSPKGHGGTSLQILAAGRHDLEHGASPLYHLSSAMSH